MAVTRAYVETTQGAKNNVDYFMGATYGTVGGTLGRMGEGIGCLIATGAECVFGWTAPEGKQPPPGVWSPWR